MAELSPELASRIQALETSYADNPGRYFVALAGAWREAGEPGRAEEILRENIKKFPGLSPHVLLGRCLADRGAFPEAANEFHYVLSIDAQNLIALRSLAEMAAAGGRRDEAERWYNELLAVDPMNAEARGALAQLARGGADASTADQPARVGTGWGGAAETVPGDAADFGMIDLSAPAVSAADASGAAADADDWGDLALEMDAETAAPAAAPAGEFDAFGFGSVELDAAPGDEDAGDETGGVEEWLAADARQDLGESAAEDRGALAPEEETVPGDDTSAPDLTFMDEEGEEGEEEEDVGGELPLLDIGAAPAFPAFEAPGDAGFPAFEMPAEDVSAALPSFSAEPEAPAEHAEAEVDAEVVTETMAELYAAQGLHQQAAEVYRELIRQRGDEPGLVRRLAELEGQAQPAGAEGPAAAPAAEETPDWLASVDAFAAGATGGEVDAPADAFAAPAPAAGLGAAEPADAFADSFAAGFAGEAVEAAEPAPAAAGAEADREPWEAPSVRETEPVGFDLIVVEEGEEMVPAPPEVVAEVSADWAIAAAPLEEQEEAVEAAAPAASAAAPAARSVRAYFTGLLAWQPGAASAEAAETMAPPPAAEEPAYEAPSAPAEPEADEEPWAETPAAPPAHEPAAEEEPWSAPAAEAPADQAPAAEEAPWAAPDVEAPADQAPAAEEEPWTAPAAEAPGEEAPAASPDDIPLIDLDEEPWAEAPRPAAPVDIAGFTLADEIVAPPAEPGPAEVSEAASAEPDGADEEPLPWELPAEPAAQAPAAEPDISAFSFEDFFAGTPPAAASAPPAPEPEPARPVPEPEMPAGFTPSAAFEPAPEAPAPPAPAALPAPAAPPASAAPQQGAGQDEEDEDLESFQAWLQSLKR